MDKNDELKGMIEGKSDRAIAAIIMHIVITNHGMYDTPAAFVKKLLSIKQGFVSEGIMSEERGQSIIDASMEIISDFLKKKI